MMTLPKEMIESIPLINGIDGNKFPKLLSRIIDKIPDNESQIFTDDEEIKLQTVLSIDESDKIKLLIETLRLIMKQIAYSMAKPKTIANELTEMGLNDEKVILLLELWSNDSNKVYQRMRDNSFGIAPNQLIDVNCKLKIMTNNDCASRIKTPAVQLDIICSDGSDKIKNVSIDFDHIELSQFYNNLEAIQTQIDVLQK